MIKKYLIHIKRIFKWNAGVIINSFDDKFEIYTYIKNKDKIASVHYYYGKLIEEKANKYYNRS
jgi:hypothetical protein